MIRNNIDPQLRGPEHPAHRVPAAVFTADINNNIVYRGAREAVRVDSPLGTGTGSLVRIFNNTFFRNNGRPSLHRDQHRRDAEPLRRPAQQHRGGRRRRRPTSRGTASALCTNAANCDWWNAASGNNITGDAAPPTRPPTGKPPTSGPNPRGGGVASGHRGQPQLRQHHGAHREPAHPVGQLGLERGVEPDRLRLRRHRRRRPQRALGRRRRRAAAGRRAAADRLQRQRGLGRCGRCATRPTREPPGPRRAQVAVAGPVPDRRRLPLFTKVARTQPERHCARAVVFAEADTGSRQPQLHATVLGRDELEQRRPGRPARDCHGVRQRRCDA